MLRIGRLSINLRCLKLVVSGSHFSQKASLETKIVELSVGKVRGKHQIGITGHAYYSFEGIPFGEPPIGELRFSPTQPARPWSGCLDCLEERPRPVQKQHDSDCTIGDEDCLYLNVFSKHFDAGKPLPVLVFIHGGAFQTGGATRTKYGPDYLMREDIVYVQFSYRLCALGFLSLTCADLGVPGNAGLHDQLLALRWTKEHILHFNGDPENITVMGSSAGAASVHFMMCLPEACGLFHRAIMMSGAMTCPWVQIPNAEALFYRLACEKGYRGIMLEAPILQFLRSLPAEQLVKHDLISLRDCIFGHLFPFVPTQEFNATDEGLLKKPYLKMMKEAWSKNVPLLIGGTSFEGLMMYPYLKVDNSLIMHMLKAEPGLLLPYDIYRRLSKIDQIEPAKLLICFHYGPRKIHVNDVMQTLDMFSYKLFWHGIHRVVLSRLAFAQAPTYIYRFDFDSSKNNLMRINLCGNDIKTGVCHADDLGYMFPRQRVHPFNEAECLTMNRLVGILTTFARTGNPKCAETGNEKWTPVSEKNPFLAMNISNEVTFGTQVEKEGTEVWNKIYDNDKELLYGK